MTARQDEGSTIVVRDRRKPNQYTTDNIVAREWLPILRVGDAFFFYSVYLSMANRETESSWSSLRTLAKYLQCGVDLIIRGNKLLQICELIHVEQGNQRTSNEYFILDPPTLTPELLTRIERRLDEILAQETGVNWQSWVNQVRKALQRHRSLNAIWAERRAQRGGRPVKTVRPQEGAREPQPPLPAMGAREPQAGYSWDTNAAHVTHDQGAHESRPEQEQETSKHEETDLKDQDALFALVRARCRRIGVAAPVLAVLFEKHALEALQQQLDWLPCRNPREPAAMLVSAVQGNWDPPATYDPQESDLRWQEWMGEDAQSLRGDALPAAEIPTSASVITRRAPSAPRQSPPVPEEPSPSSADDAASLSLRGGAPSAAAIPNAAPGPNALPTERVASSASLLEATTAWDRVLDELRMQMTRATFDTWLNGAQVVAVRENDLVVRVRDAYAAEWLRGRWVTPIERTVRDVIGRPLHVRFEI